jgi:hypothetical protein
MSKFSKKGVLMVYSNDECGEEGGAEEALAHVAAPQVPDASKKTELAHHLANKNFDDDDDDVYIKFSDLPENYFDDLLDLDFSAPAKKPKLRQLILLGMFS